MLQSPEAAVCKYNFYRALYSQAEYERLATPHIFPKQQTQYV
jgi:hypothetical protein